MSLSHGAAPASPAPALSPAEAGPSAPASPEEAIAALTGASAPYLVGVRHHAPSLAAAVPALLDEAAPEVLLVELPAEMQPWLPWLGHEETRAPVALAAAPADGGGGPAFYPFADFSPELAAVRWAVRRGVPVVACDLPLADRAWSEGRPAAGGRAGGPGLAAALRAGLTGRAGDDLWDRLVEAAAPGSPPEALRRAALLTGWALREDAAASGGVPELDLRRERWMRARLAEATAHGERAAVVVGAFHAPALAGREAGGGTGEGSAEKEGAGEGAGTDAVAQRPAWTTSLIPYTYALLDERSGYPAGIRDPEWQDMVLRAAGDPAALEEALTRAAVRVCAELRSLGHPSGPADAREISRLASDLARLRGLPAAGRGELVEAVQTVLAQGEPYGRGRAVARAMERVLVGTRGGRPAPRAPRSGLAPAVEAEAARLGLPGPRSGGPGPSRDVRLDPLRSDLDRRRELLLRRLAVCGVPYGEAGEVVGAGGAEALTSRWEVRWTPATDAMLTAAGVRGVTPAQAAEGVLRERRRLEHDEGGPTAAQALEGLRQAAECGLAGLADERLGEVADVLPRAGTLPELLAGLALLDRLRAGHVPGLGAEAGRAARAAAAAEPLTAAAVRQVDGLTGSEDPADARALLELSSRADLLGGIRLSDALARLSADGSPLMRGAAGAVRVLLGHEDAQALGDRVASWVDGATDPDSRAALTARLSGLLTAAGPLLEAAPPALEPLLARVAELPDRAFLDRLPALRGGFDTLSPAARGRLLAAVEERLGAAHVADTGGADPAALAAWAGADLAARETLRSMGLLPAPAGDPAEGVPKDAGPAPGATTPGATGVAAPAVPPAGERLLAPADRWRLLLGRRTDRLAPSAAPLATALDELYGGGRGEGSRGELTGPGGGGGREAPYPGVREWSEELAALFGPGIREEVLAAAAASGRRDVLAELDADGVRPSVDLLRTVLRHAGGLPEARLAALRPLVRRLVDALTRQLATRLRPALHGTALPRPSRRPGGGLDLPRTLRANLATARRSPDGTVRVIPERPVFRARGRRAADWRLILVTDVSGSMEASTVWAALTASVLAGVPTLSTHFLAFSTEVIDLTGHVDDPLSLLLEVSVGGGTHIAAGLRHARELVTVPSRTLVVVVSDFEEGHPLGGLLAEVRALVGAGCHVLGCASLDDTGRPRYSTSVAGRLVDAGMPVAALSPLELARWAGEKIA
ncbi:vWA domain-containing protein [Streptomyces radiopugnans]|uniref:VWA domain containing CoxE-like protein n=1 Tax=Streptomyces radiopugnans TaxID=403935 RepID=A0A1H9JTG3_9ACTN|nr:VWA domain containing CoxE-like protein [Streptomyces radiopugnans]